LLETIFVAVNIIFFLSFLLADKVSINSDFVSRPTLSL